MSEPTTEAGRRLLDDLTQPDSDPIEVAAFARSSILAIEAEARAEALDVDVLRASFRRGVQTSISNETADRMGRLLGWAIEDARRRTREADALDVDVLARLIDEVYQRGMDAPEAAAFIRSAILAEPKP